MDGKASAEDLQKTFELFLGSFHSLEKKYERLTQTIQMLNDEVSKANLRTALLLDSMPASVILLEDNLVTHFNPAALDIFPELKSGNLWEIPNDWEKSLGPNEFKYAKENGTHATVQLIQVSSGNKSVIQIQDITENILTLKEKETYERLASMGMVAAGIAHQVRTPLATALLHSSNLCQLSRDNYQLNQYAEKIKDQLQKLGRLSSSMITFLKTNSSEKNNVSVNDLIDNAVEISTATLNGKKIKLEKLLPTADYYIYCDKLLLASAISNLIENAANHSHLDGVINLTIKSEDDLVHIYVEDFGSGIPAEIASRLFEPFNTSSASGSGLGLAIAQSIISDCGGKISGKNKQGSPGALFLASLPTTK